MGKTLLKRNNLFTLFIVSIFIKKVKLFNFTDGIGTAARYRILYKRDSFSVMGRGNILPTKGPIGEMLSLTNLLLAEGGGDGGIKGTVDVINASSGMLTKKALVRI